MQLTKSATRRGRRHSHAVSKEDRGQEERRGHKDWEGSKCVFVCRTEGGQHRRHMGCRWLRLPAHQVRERPHRIAKGAHLAHQRGRLCTGDACRHGRSVRDEAHVGWKCGEGAAEMRRKDMGGVWGDAQGGLRHNWVSSPS